MFRRALAAGLVVVLASWVGACDGRDHAVVPPGGKAGKPGGGAGTLGGGPGPAGGVGAAGVAGMYASAGGTGGIDAGAPELPGDAMETSPQPDVGPMGCVPLDTAMSCGPTCATCTAPSGGTPMCSGGTCDFSCGTMKKCAAAKLCIATTACCDHADCPPQAAKVGSCDTATHMCNYTCAANMKSCNGTCIPSDACCVDKDCPASCQKCGAGNSCVAVKDAEDDTCSGDHICDGVGFCASRFAVFPLPNGGVTYRIVAGSDGNLWFTESARNSVCRITPSGVVTEFQVPTPGSQPEALVLGSDGNVWFGEFMGSRIGRVSTTGTTAEYQLEAGSFLGIQAIVQGPGQPWFSSGHVIGIGTAATLSTSVTLPGEDSATSLVIGSDSNVWYTSRQNGTVGRIKISDKSVSSFSVPTSRPLADGAGPAGLTLGSDGKLRFSESADNQIGRIDANGAITEFNILTPGTMPEGACLGPDGNVWFVEVAGHGVVRLPDGAEAHTGGLGRITPTGQITEYPLPPALSGIGIAAGPDGNLWIADGPQIVRFRMK